MASTEFTRRLSPDELNGAVRSALELEPTDKVTIDLDEASEMAYGIPLRVKQRAVLDDNDVAELDDYYELSDFDITVYDWAGDTMTPTLRWRARMLDRFGTEYATTYLLEGHDRKEFA